MLCCICSTTTVTPQQPSSHPQVPKYAAPIPIRSSRRAFLTSGITLLSSACLTVANPALASPPDDPSEDVQFSAPGLYSFRYPTGWGLAYDRTRRGPTGAQVLVGNLATVDTFSVSKRIGDGDLAVDKIIDLLVEDVRSTPTSMRFEVISNGVANHEDGEKYAEMEYLVETCRGTVEEELGGEKVCGGPNEMVLQTVSRRHLLGVVRKGDVVYVLNGGALEGRWEQVGEDVHKVFDSFVLL